MVSASFFFPLMGASFSCLCLLFPFPLQKENTVNLADVQFPFFFHFSVNPEYFFHPANPPLFLSNALSRPRFLSLFQCPLFSFFFSWKAGYFLSPPSFFCSATGEGLFLAPKILFLFFFFPLSNFRLFPTIFGGENTFFPLIPDYIGRIFFFFCGARTPFPPLHNEKRADAFLHPKCYFFYPGLSPHCWIAIALFPFFRRGSFFLYSVLPGPFPLHKFLGNSVFSCVPPLPFLDVRFFFFLVWTTHPLCLFCQKNPSFLNVALFPVIAKIEGAWLCFSFFKSLFLFATPHFLVKQ